MRISDWSSDVSSSDLEGGPEQIALDLFISKADLRSGAHHIGRIATVAPSRRNGSVVIDEMTVVQQETDIVDRSPDERCHIAVLRAAENSGIIQVEPVITNIDLPSAPSAFAYRIANLYTLENAAFIFAMIVGEEDARLD